MTMLICCHLIFNTHFLGEAKQLEAIQTELSSAFEGYSLQTIHYQSDDSEIASKLASHLKPRSQIPILIVSGSQGYQFLMKKDIQEIVAQTQPLIIWVGHQDPGLIHDANLFDIVALPLHIIEEKPALKIFGDRLVAMEGVPNTLQEKDLTPAFIKWNTTYPEEEIRFYQPGSIGVFLGGPAPQANGEYLYESLELIKQRGIKFGEMAAREKKNLWIVNGPRTGKFYSESKDKSDPVLRQFDTKGWIAFDALTDDQQKITVKHLATIGAPQKEPIAKTLAHTHQAPMDPETLAFIEGIKESGFANYQIFDFKATPGQTTKSAYVPVIAALKSNEEVNIACYSGESISYAEIAYFIPRTFAFSTDTMNVGHKNALKRFNELHMVGVLDFEKSIKQQPLDLKKKFEAIKPSNQLDSKKIVDALKPKIMARLQTEKQKSMQLSNNILRYGILGGTAITYGLLFWYKAKSAKPSSEMGCDNAMSASRSSVSNK